MMVIRMRHTRAHTGNRRSHHALKGNTIVTDADTKTKHMRHRASLDTGMYRGRQVFDITKKAVKNAKKAS
ncbi:50S ribosomal protein L32 [Patescibacteria group bacterium]|nr:50S ribosomal protein L32 [Patescibacteria group bacterium]